MSVPCGGTLPGLFVEEIARDRALLLAMLIVRNPFGVQGWVDRFP